MHTNKHNADIHKTYMKAYIEESSKPQTPQIQRQLQRQRDYIPQRQRQPQRQMNTSIKHMVAQSAQLFLRCTIANVAIGFASKYGTVLCALRRLQAVSKYIQELYTHGIV